jgi:hypothetical protein
MKSSEKIIAHITGKPLFRKIGQKRCFEKLISLLPPQLSRAVMFTYVKNKTLFFVLNHPGLKMEFNYKITLIKSLLKKIKDIDPDCQNIDVTDIKAFVTNKINFDPPPPPETKFTYKERATGRFYNFATDPKLKQLFQEIKEEIRKNAVT